jgi:hypothetical protein
MHDHCQIFGAGKQRERKHDKSVVCIVCCKKLLSTKKARENSVQLQKQFTTDKLNVQLQCITRAIISFAHQRNIM